MIDILPFPRINARTTEGKIAELENYLIQFKETLEFALMNISTDNLSADLVKKLNDLGANIQTSNKDRDEEMAQVSAKKSLTVYDVVNSDVFKASVDSRVSEITFSVNFATGQLEYATGGENGNN